MKEKEKELVQREEKEEEECETVRRWMTNLLSGRERKVGGGSVPVLSTPEGKKKKKRNVCVFACVYSVDLARPEVCLFISILLLLYTWTINDAAFCSDNPIKSRTQRHKHAHAHCFQGLVLPPAQPPEDIDHYCWTLRKMQRQKEWKKYG